MNGNGYLSLAEVDKGMRDVIQLPELFDLKPVMLRAFNAAKAKVPGSSKYADDYVTKSEYRWLLKYLRIYYEYWVAFDRIDAGGDRRVDYSEFLAAKTRLETWGINMSNPDASWKECDKNGGGQVLFDEFSEWAIKKGLDLEDDDNDDPDINEKVPRKAVAPPAPPKHQQQAKIPPPGSSGPGGPGNTAQQTDKFWVELEAKLPWKKTDEDQKLRVQQW